MVRSANRDDAAAIARMLHDFNLEFGDPSPGVEVLEPRVRTFIENGAKSYLLAGERGPEGFAQVDFRPSVLSDGPVAMLEEFYVLPDLRGGGRGTAILKAVLDMARGRGAATVELGTGEDDTGARRLYERFGFINQVEGDQNARALWYELQMSDYRRP